MDDGRCTHALDPYGGLLLRAVASLGDLLVWLQPSVAEFDEGAGLLLPGLFARDPHI